MLLIRRAGGSTQTFSGLFPDDWSFLVIKITPPKGNKGGAT